jgi:hypothetical protein
LTLRNWFTGSPNDIKIYLPNLNLYNRNIPVLIILTHRSAVGTASLQYGRDHPIYDASYVPSGNIVGNMTFYPDYIKMYEMLAYKYGFAVINMFKKSCDELGGLANDVSTATPTGYFLDGTHLGETGNASYEEELRKLFYWYDLN